MPRLYDDDHTQQHQRISTATSARSENYFRTLKNNILDSKNERVDKVVIKHLRALSGTVKLQAAEQESIRYNKKAQNILFNEELRTIEDSFIGLSETNEYPVQEDNSSISREKNNHTESPSKNSLYNSQHTQNVQLSNTKKNSPTHIFQHVKPISVSDTDPASKMSSVISIKSMGPESNRLNSNSEGFNPQSRPLNSTQTIEKEHVENSFILSSPQFCSTRMEWTDQASDEKTDARETLKDITLSVNAHLNEIENWKGLNKKKHRGIYLRPCPDIENKLANPKLCHKLPLLINGNSLCPIKTYLGKMKIKNTCGFDALTHAVRCGIVDWVKYQQAVKESKTPFMIFVKKFAECGRNQEIYRSRAELILSIKSPEENIVDCNLNIGNLADSLFGKEESVQCQLECPKCKSIKTNFYKTIMVNLTPLCENGLNGLQESLNLFASDSNYKCRQCAIKKNVHFIGSCHLIIDIEALQWSLAAHREGFTEEYTQKFPLTNMPINLNFMNSTYRLVAVVEHIKSCDDDVNHYQTYVRRFSGKWEVHDGMTTKSIIKRVSQKTMMENKVFHLLFYVKI